MKRLSIQVAALAIVTGGLPCAALASTGAIDDPQTSYAPLAFDDSPITQHTCHQLYVRDTDYQVQPRRAMISDRIYEEPVSVNYDALPRKLANLVTTLNDADFDEGYLSITDCVGGSSTTDVRKREFSLDYINRQGTQRRGLRFSAEATNEAAQIIRVTRMELPPEDAWTVNRRGNGLIAAEALFHVNNDNDANVGYYRRIRVTEVSWDGNDVLVRQRFSINERFSELQSWTLEN